MKILLTSFYDPTDLGIRYLASYLKRHGHEVGTINLKVQHKAEFVDLPAMAHIDKAVQCLNGSVLTQNFLSRLPVTQEEFRLYKAVLEEFSPQVVGLSTRSINFKLLPNIIQAIREALPGIKIIAGGAGPTLEPHIPLNYGAHIVVRGEGEYALNELLTLLQHGEDWRQGHNLAWLEAGAVKTTPLLPLERCLDAFSDECFDPDTHLIIENDDIHKYTDKSAPQGISSHIAFYLATRGCPADCSYCSGRRIRNLYKNCSLSAPRMRKKSLTNVINDLEKIVTNKAIHFIDFCDEYFIYPTSHLLAFFKEYKEKINLPFHMNLSIDQLAENMELLDAAYEAGMAQLWIGLQTGSEEFCKRVYNRVNHNENIIKVVTKWKSNHMTLNVFMIAGNPLERDSDRRKTYDLLARFPKFDPSFKSFTNFRTSKLTVFPDTALSKYFHEDTPLCTNRDFYYEAMLIALRTLLDDSEFESVLKDPEYKTHPALLARLYHSTISRRHSDYLCSHLVSLNNTQAIFWGPGQVYKQLGKEVSRYVQPAAIVIDSLYRAEHDESEAILTPAQALERFGSTIPIIAFGHTSNLGRMHRSIEKHGFTGPIISCAQVAHID